MLDYDVLEVCGRAVAHVQRVEAACEPAGLAEIERAAVEQGLNRIVVAGCPSRLYADRFAALMDRLGLPRYLLERANIREGAAWAHADPAAATAAARGAIEMAIAGVRETPPAGPLTTTVDHTAHEGEETRADESRVLVLGGGLAGMTAALTLASLGVEADLVEREAHLGGNLRDRLRTLEGLDAQALLAETVARLERSPVRVWTGAELVGWSGVRGAFAAEIRRVGEEHDAEPLRARYGALIVATGAAPARPSEAMRVYRYGVDARVVTQTELEHRLAEDAPFRTQLAGTSVVMVQCVGSRDEAHPYCSRVCCQAAIKNALALKALDPAIEVSILYRDVRTLGLQERSYQRARRLGVHLFRYEPPELPVVETGDASPDRVRVTVQDQLYDQRVTLAADWVVLSTGIAPVHADNRRLADLLDAPLDEDGFFEEAHPKLRPTDLARPGLHLCGLAYGPRTIEETLAQARAAALRAALDVTRPPEPRDDVATVVPKLCSYCGLCVILCPYGARVLDEENRHATVIDHLCQGCGACVAVCPNDASRQPALDPARLLAMVDAVMDQKGIL
jgi:heterodisulfide reductase subunit A